MRAILWTPDDLIQLDLEPMLVRETRRLERFDDLNARWFTPIPSLAKGRAELVAVLELIVAQAREVPPYDLTAAEGFIAGLRERATRLRRRCCAWAYEQAAVKAAYRLFPHHICTCIETPRIPAGILARAEHLRRH